MKSRRYSGMILLILALAASSQVLFATGKTAFILAKEGNKFIPPQAKDKVTQIRSEKTGDSLVPDVWYVSYFDPTAALKSTEVKFVNGEMTAVTQPKHMLDLFNGSQQMDRKKLKIDSDAALALALKLPMLTTVKVRAVQFWLSRDAGTPTWKIRFWAAKPGASDEVEIGDLYLSSKNGDVLKNHLHVSSAY